MSAAVTITPYLPPTADRPSEPAPYVMTEEDVLRMIGVTKETDRAKYMFLWSQRDTHGLRSTRMGKEIRYLLPDVLRWLENLREDRTK